MRGLKTYLGDKDSEHEGHNELQAASGFHDHDCGSEGEPGGTPHESCSPHHGIGRQTDRQVAAAANHDGPYYLPCYPPTYTARNNLSWCNVNYSVARCSGQARLIGNRCRPL